eukprot:6496520-Ditylum_brightwellii.AAC.1
MNELDANLNKDIHDDVRRHVSKTCTLPDDETQKFSIMTEKKGALAYLQLWDPSLQIEYPEHGIPSSSRIIQDMERIQTE